MQGDRGVTLAELLVTIAVIAAGIAIALPAAAQLRDAGRAAAGARTLCASFSGERWQSVARRKSTGFLFERTAAGWGFREVEDGNGNGLSTAEIRSGVDPTIGASRRLESWVPGAYLGFPPGGPFPKIPPDRGNLDTSDPVQFGRSDIVSFSPFGASSSGTIYVTDGKEALYAVVVFGPTVRLRVWRYVYRERRWTL